jgi:hypothetical protein
MKLTWDLWKKIRRWRPGHDDPQTRHVEKALRKEVREQLPIGEDWFVLSSLPSHDGKNGASSTPVPRMTEHPVADVPDAFKGSQGNETSPKDNAPVITDESTRDEPTPRPNGLRHDTREPEANISSPIHASPMNYNRPKRRDSPTFIRNYSPDGRSQISENLFERPDNPKFIPVGQDHLSSFYDDVYPSDSIFQNPANSESLFDAEDHAESTVSRPYYSKPGLDLQKHPEPVQEEQNHSQSISYRQLHTTLNLTGPHSSKIYSERPYIESATSEVQGLSESTTQKPDQPEITANHRDFEEPILEGRDDPRQNRASQDPEKYGDEGQGLSTSVEIRLDPPEKIPQGVNQPEPESAGQDEENFISDKQSRSESIRSEKRLMVKDQQRRLRREAKLHNLLSRSLQTRARAYEKRSQLRQSRVEISNADEAFMKLIRERRFQGNEDDATLQANFEKLQDTRNKYGPLEEAYNAIEEQLNREEYETRELEDKILKSEIPASELDIDSRSNSPSEDDSESPQFIKEVYHPLFEAYLSRLGDADLCREAIAELMMEQDSLLQTQEVRRRVGLELSPDDQVTLQNFPAAEAKLLSELTRTEADVEYLRLECAKEGLFGENEMENGDGGEDEAEVEEIDLLRPSIGSVEPIKPKYDKYSILLGKPEVKEDENKSKVLLTDFKQGDVGDRITCWLLHKLRSSGMEVELLARLADGVDRSGVTEKWQEEVLEFWFFDSANLPASAYEVEPTTHTAFPPSPLTETKKFSDHFSDSQLIQLAVRSSALSRKFEFGMLLKLTRMKGKSAMTI